MWDRANVCVSTIRRCYVLNWHEPTVYLLLHSRSLGSPFDGTMVYMYMIVWFVCVHRSYTIYRHTVHDLWWRCEVQHASICASDSELDFSTSICQNVCWLVCVRGKFIHATNSRCEHNIVRTHSCVHLWTHFEWWPSSEHDNNVRDMAEESIRKQKVSLVSTINSPQNTHTQ